MTVERYEPAELAVAAPAAQNITGGALRLVEWAKEAEAAHQLALALCETPFAGAYAKNPGAATAAILKGAEVGLTPVTSLGAFDLIQGQPAPKAITLRALAQSHGHTVWIEKSSEKECVAKGRRRGETEVHISRWTIDRAHRLKLTGKDNWAKQPEAMLIARATAEVCRMVASDVILGIGYSAEEVADDAEPAPVRRISRGKSDQPEPPEPDLEPTPTESPLLNTSSALARKMFALLGDVGKTDKADRLVFVSDVVGREVGSSTEMTDAEAEKVIARCEDMIAQPFAGDEPGFEGTPDA